MNTTVKATETRSINVTINEEEAFKAICNLLHVGHLIQWNDDSKTRWRESRRKYGPFDTLDYLIEEEDISYHGTSHWKPTGKIENDNDTLQNYEVVKELKARLKSEKLSRDVKDALLERGIIQED